MEVCSAIGVVVGRDTSDGIDSPVESIAGFGTGDDGVRDDHHGSAKLAYRGVFRRPGGVVPAGLEGFDTVRVAGFESRFAGNLHPAFVHPEPIDVADLGIAADVAVLAASVDQKTACQPLAFIEQESVPGHGGLRLFAGGQKPPFGNDLEPARPVGRTRIECVIDETRDLFVVAFE
jgi:hypothetical protein